jgi:type I restriction enzyme S subunit
LIDEQTIRLSDLPLICSNFCRRLVLSDHLDPRFVWYQLHHHYVLGDTDQYQRATTNIRNLQVPHYLEGTALVIPPRGEQERIVAAIEEQFSRLDAGMVALGRARQNLKRMRAAAIDAALTGRLTPQDPQDESSQVLFQRMSSERANSPRGKLVASVDGFFETSSRDWPIPGSWITVPLPFAAYFQEGPGLRQWQFRESGIPFLNIRTLQDGRIVRRLCQYLDPVEVDRKYSHFLVEEGDILCSTSGTIGKVAVATKDDLPIMLNTSVVRFRPYGPSGPEPGFIMLFLQSPYFMDQARKAVTGSAQINLGPSHLKRMIFPLPPLAEQRRIVERSQQLLPMLAALDKTIDAAAKRDRLLRSSILAAAFSGNLVPQEPTDEPASALIERIAGERASPNGHNATRTRRPRTSHRKYPHE